MRLSTVLFVFSLLLVVGSEAFSQTLENTDRIVTWRTYDLGHDRSARVRVYPSADERRPLVVVVNERAGGAEPSTAEASYVAEVIAREFGFDPVDASFVFRFTPASFVEGASDSGKELLLRVTFRRLASGNIGSPNWRVLSRDELSRLTDRAL